MLETISILKKYIFRVIPLFKNFFFATGFFLLIWMIFFDGNDFVDQWRLTQKLSELERQKAYYQTKIEEVKLEKTEIFGSSNQIEKFAREHYLMKKPSEDLYIVKR